MAQFLEQYYQLLEKSEDYDMLALNIDTCLRRNIVSALNTNIKEIIDKLGILPPFSNFIKIMVWAATISDHGETCLELLRYFCNKIVKEFDSSPIELDELSVVTLLICADDKSFIQKFTKDQKKSLFQTIAKFYLSITENELNDPGIIKRAIESMDLIVEGKNMSDLDQIFKSNYDLIDDVNERIRTIELVRPFQAVFINIIQNIDQSSLLTQINEYYWNIDLNNKIYKCISTFTSKYKDTQNDDYEYFIRDFIMFCQEYNKDMNNTGYTWNAAPINPVYGKLIWNFMDLLHYAYDNMHFDTLKIVHLLNHCKQIFFESFAITDDVKYGINALISTYVDSGKYEDAFLIPDSNSFKSIKMYLNNNDIFKFWLEGYKDNNKDSNSDTVYKAYITNYYVQGIEIANELLEKEDDGIATEAIRNNRSDEAETIQEDDNSDEDESYNGPEIKATQSTKGYKRSSKIQADGERKIYKAYKTYKNAESKVDSQLSKMLASAKKAFSQDKTEEIIEGKRFTPIGLLKKILVSAAIFNYSKIAGFIYLLVSHTISKKRTEKQKKEILMDIEAEIKMLDEKIEDARGDGNRKAKYALMRTKTELTRARDKIKYNLTATKADMATAKSYLSNNKRDNL